MSKTDNMFYLIFDIIIRNENYKPYGQYNISHVNN